MSGPVCRIERCLAVVRRVEMRRDKSFVKPAGDDRSSGLVGSILLLPAVVALDHIRGDKGLPGSMRANGAVWLVDRSTAAVLEAVVVLVKEDTEHALIRSLTSARRHRLG